MKKIHTWIIVSVFSYRVIDSEANYSIQIVIFNPTLNALIPKWSLHNGMFNTDTDLQCFWET